MDMPQVETLSVTTGDLLSETLIQYNDVICIYQYINLYSPNYSGSKEKKNIHTYKYGEKQQNKTKYSEQVCHSVAVYGNTIQ